jgi:hypothetical protein
VWRTEEGAAGEGKPHGKRKALTGGAKAGLPEKTPSLAELGVSRVLCGGRFQEPGGHRRKLMADTSEAIALRLREFIQAAERRANAGGDPNQVHTLPAGRTARTKPPGLLKVCKEYLSTLKDEELAALDRIIQKMSGGEQAIDGPG